VLILDLLTLPELNFPAAQVAPSTEDVLLSFSEVYF